MAQQPYQQWPAVPPAPPIPFWVPSLHVFETFPRGTWNPASPNILLQIRDSNVFGGYNFLYGASQWGISTQPLMYSAIATEYQPDKQRADVVLNAQDAEDLILANLSTPIDGDPNKRYAIRFSTTPPSATTYPGDVERMTILNTGEVGVNQSVPVNQFDVGGNSVIGAAYAGSVTAPVNGLLVQGELGVGYTSNPGAYKFYVNGNSYFNGTGTWSGGAIWSDARFKTNVAPIQDALAKVNALTGVSFDYRDADFKDRNFPTGHQIGFIAQEVEKVVPEVVVTNADGYKAVAYQNLTALLAQAIKEQQQKSEQQNAALMADNAKLMADNQAMRAQLDDQTLRIARLEQALQKLADNSQLKQSSTSASSSASEAQLFQNDPNPFSESTRIGYFLPASVAHAELIVYSAATGKQVLAQTITSTGNGTALINAKDLGASGAYYYTMVADGVTVHGRSMIVVK
jgi:hypothetical protein